jgi:hypothetical protein
MPQSLTADARRSVTSQLRDYCASRRIFAVPSLYVKYFMMLRLPRIVHGSQTKTTYGILPVLMSFYTFLLETATKNLFWKILLPYSGGGVRFGDSLFELRLKIWFDKILNKIKFFLYC